MTGPQRLQGLRWLGSALLVCAAFGTVGVITSPGRAAPPAPSPRFESDVLPIFKAHCARCHGIKPRKAGLNLSKREGIFEGSDSGPVIVPGKVEESLLF